MRAAVLTEIGAPPSFAEFEDPVAGDGRVVVEVTAAGVNHVDLAKASGGFYLGPPAVPSVLGSDGVGRLADDRRVFFDAPVSPYGSWGERSLVRQDALLDVAEGVEDAVAAALGNTGLAAWLALQWRAAVQPGECVLVLGANGAVGSVAVQAAKILGAGTVVAAGRDADRLQRLRERGADASVVIGDSGGDDDLVAAFRDAADGGPDVIIDPLWGTPALAAMKAAAHGARLIQIGQLAGVHVSLPAPVVRSAGLDVRGFAVFHVPLQTKREAYLRLTEHAAHGEIVVDMERLPLREVGTAWGRQQQGAGTKLVLIP